MAEPTRVAAPIGGDDKTISFETGKLAGLAGGAVMAGMGDTRILVTATGAKHVRDGIDFFPNENEGVAIFVRNAVLLIGDFLNHTATTGTPDQQPLFDFGERRPVPASDRLGTFLLS